MALLGFKKRFVPLIKSGRKRQTIRTFRKHPIKAGELLHLYTALRTKYCERIRKPVVCTSNELIHIHFNAGVVILPEEVIEGVAELNRFAKADGFKDWADLKAFWIAEHGVKKGKRKVILTVFKGTLTKW